MTNRKKSMMSLCFCREIPLTLSQSECESIRLRHNLSVYVYKRCTNELVSLACTCNRDNVSIGSLLMVIRYVKQH